MSERGDVGRRLADALAGALEPASGPRAERIRLAGAMRRVIEGLLTSDAPEDELARAADALERYADRLADHPRADRYWSWSETSPAGDAGGHFDRSPLIGAANPLAPPIELVADEATGRVRGRAHFGAAYEGPPGHVHGGFVAAAFDEVLGMANTLSQTPGMTAMLRVNYRRPTPLHTDLHFEARLERVEGRKIFTRGELRCGDALTADAEGLFVSVDFQRFQQMYAERQRRRSESER